ncbi:MAG: DUF4251 domain-containing protein, partial [Bacteroidota bacterium]
MKKHVMILLALLVCGMSFAQEKSKKQQKQEKEEALIATTKSLIFSKNFQFEGLWMYPLSGTRISLISTPHSFILEGDTSKARMPFVGTRQYANAGKPGINFDGEVMDYSAVYNEKKQSYSIKYKVKSDKDTFKITLKVQSNGYAKLIIDSSKRTSVSYDGEITEIKI